ncbi:MAG TPA: hypothetical protein VK973_05755 [Arenicellales bacterium]|nr:hypothetical protein [Arenicellales bacterium]
MQAQQQKLQRRLKLFYSKKAAKLGLGLTPSCCTLIERMINNGIERMVSQGATEREEQIQVAERNLSHYLQRLSEEAQHRGTFPQVGAKAFDSVFNMECPIWPFC